MENANAEEGNVPPCTTSDVTTAATPTTTTATTSSNAPTTTTNAPSTATTTAVVLTAATAISTNITSTATASSTSSTGGGGATSASTVTAVMPALLTASSNATSFANIVTAAGLAGNTTAASAAVSPPAMQMPTQSSASSTHHQLLLDEGNSLSLLGAATSEGQRSLSAAPSASSSPIQSPPAGKIFGRNANGTMIATTRPTSEAEMQVYRVLQHASLLSYYDTMLEMGGDDVKQLCDAKEEEFLEIMALVGMASKPLHVRRLQKALLELFPTPFNPSASAAAVIALGETTPTKGRGVLVAPPHSISGGASVGGSGVGVTTFYKHDQPQPQQQQQQQQQSSPSLSMMRCGVAGGSGRYPTYTPTTPTLFHPTPLLSTVTQNTPSVTTAAAAAAGVGVAAGVGAGVSASSSSTSASFLSQLCSTPAITVPVIQPHTALLLPSGAAPQSLGVVPPPMGVSSIKASAAVAAAVAAAVTPPHHQQPPTTSAPPSSATTHQVSSSSQQPQLTPALTDSQIARITQGAEKIASQLPQREPRAQAMKKRATRELEQVIAMSKDDPRRMEEIRKYSAIYGRFDCKRRPEKPLTLHEVCVNEAAAQLCRLVPALLTRRDELFPLARQIVKDVGFGHSASIARYGSLLPQIQQTQAAAAAAAAAASAASSASLMTTPVNTQRSSVVVDCESSDSSSATMSTNGAKRKRLAFSDAASGEVVGAPELSRESTEDSRYNLFAMYQKFAKPQFDLTDIAKFSFGKADYDEDHDNDSRFSFSNSGSPPIPQNGSELHETRINHHTNSVSNWPLPTAQEEVHSTAVHINQRTRSIDRERGLENASKVTLCNTEATLTPSTHAGVHVISAAAAGHIIAVANPALALSPTLNEALSLKREADSPDI